MKRTIYNHTWICLLAVLLVCSACEKSMMSYEGPESIYFSMQKDAKPSENVYKRNSWINLTLYMQDEVEYGLNVKITGDPKDYDRPYQITVIADSTTAVAGEDYIIPEGGVIKAGQISDSLYVKLKKNEKLEDVQVKLCVQVVPNEHFTTEFAEFAHDGRWYNVFDSRIHNIFFSNMLEEPYWWDSDDDDYPIEGGDFGFFTAKKITLINELYDLTYADWLDTDEGGTGEMNLTRNKVIYKKFALYLIEQYKNGTPVLEEDGRLMWVTGCPWESAVGVPWDGTFMDLD